MRSVFRMESPISEVPKYITGDGYLTIVQTYLIDAWRPCKYNFQNPILSNKVC
jgi:hypothetical protein